MLVLSRRIGESLKIGDQVEITVMEIRGARVRLSIVAPETIAVHRQEIYERIKQEQRSGRPAARVDTTARLQNRRRRNEFR